MPDLGPYHVPNPSGTWKKGQSGNPAGSKSTGFQSFKDRLAYWCDHKTTDEILALVKNKKEWGKLLSIDGMVVRRIEAALRKEGSNADFNSILDRLIGRPVQEITGKDGSPLLASALTDEQLNARLQAQLQIALASMTATSLPDAKVPVMIEQSSDDKKDNQ